MAATSILSRFLAYEIAVPISQPEKTLEFQNYKLIFFIYLYLLFSLNVVNELVPFVPFLMLQASLFLKRTAKIRSFLLPPNFFRLFFSKISQ